MIVDDDAGAKALGKSPRLADTGYEVRAAVEAACSHWPLPATRGGFFKPSLDGGLLLFELVLTS